MMFRWIFILLMAATHVLAVNEMCYRFTWDYGRRSFGVNPITLSFEKYTFNSAAYFYAYKRPYGSSANTGYEQKDTFLLLMTRDESGRDGFVFVMDQPCNNDGTYCGFNAGANGDITKRTRNTAGCNFECDPDGGKAGISMYMYKCTGKNCTEPYTNSRLYITLADDGPANSFFNETTPEGCIRQTKDCCSDLRNLGDCYAWDECGGFGDLQWAWATCCTDGVAMSPLPETQAWCLEMTIYRADLSLSQGSRFKFVNEKNTDGESISDRSTIKNPSRGEVGGVINICGRLCENYCASLTSCFDCVSDDRCGWCNDGGNGGIGTCVSGTELEADTGTCDASPYDFDCCDSCAAHDSCSTCLVEDGCGWCEDTQKCTTGTSLGSCLGEFNCTLFSTQDQCVFPDKDNVFFAESFDSGNADQEALIAFFQTFNPADWTQYDDPDSVKIGSWSASEYIRQRNRAFAGIDDSVDDLNPDSRGTYYLLDNSFLYSDIGLVMSIRNNERNYIGMVFRFVDVDNYYMFEWAEASDQCCNCNRRVRRIKKRRNGVVTVLAYDNIGYGSEWWYDMEIRIYDFNNDTVSYTQIDLWQDGQYVFSAKDEDVIANRIDYGAIGAYCADSVDAFFDNVQMWAVYHDLTISVDNAFKDQIGWQYYKFNANAYNIPLVFRVKILYSTENDLNGVSFYLTKDSVASVSSTADFDTYDTNAEYGFEILTSANQPGDYFIGLPLPTRVDLEVRVDIPEVISFNVSENFTSISEFSSQFLKFSVPSTIYTTIRIYVTPTNPAHEFIMYVLPDEIPYQGNLLYSTSVKTSEGKYFLQIPLPTPNTEYYVTLRSASDGVATVDSTILVELPTAVLTSISPNRRVSTAGGTQMTLSGYDFGFDGTVMIGEFECPVTSWLYNFISCTIPEGQGFALQTVVITGGSTSNSLRFDYDPPVISHIDPTTAGTEGGYLLNLFGSSFGTDGVVTVENVGECTTGSPSTSWDHELIVCEFPVGNGIFTNAQITVTTGGQTSFGITFVYSAPTITSIEPATGITDGGYTLTLVGTSFASTASVKLGSSSAVFDNNCAVNSELSNFTHIICDVNSGQGANLLVIVTVGSKDSTTTSNLRFSYARPATSSITPQNSDIVGGGSFHLKGTSFGVNPTVRFGDNSVTVFQSRNHTDIIGTIPAGNGKGRVVRVTVGGQTSTTPEVTFDYNSPNILSMFPETGPTAGAITITLQGNNFGSSGQVRLGGVSASTPFRNNTFIEFTLPQGTGLSKSVIVTSFSLPSNSFSFDYQAPVIDSITPGTGFRPTRGEVFITITGSNFGPSASTILVGASACAERTSRHTHTSIQCTLPSGQGAVDVKVTVDGQDSNLFEFVYDAPIISSIGNGQGGSTAGNEIVEIIGSNFGSVGSVTIGGQECSTSGGGLIWSDTTIECRSPVGSGLNNEVIVTVSDESDSGFIYNYGAPRIDTISPSSGSTASNPLQTIVVTGANFGDGSTLSITFDSSPIDSSSITWNSHSEIEFLLPLGTGTSKAVVVTVDSQESTCNIFFGCKVDYDAPVILNVTGCDGGLPAATNCPVTSHQITITGTSFGDIPDTSDIQVTVGGLTCSIDSISYNSVFTDQHDILCTLPGNAAGGYDQNVIVTVDGQTDTKPYLSYAGPTITAGTLQICSVGSPGSITGADTGGGQRVCFTVEGMSSPLNSEVSVVYGGTSFTLAPSGHWYNCGNVAVDGTEVSCDTSIGIGESLNFRVTVRQQVTPIGTDSFSYALPVFVNTSIRASELGSGVDEYVSKTSNGEYVYFQMENLEISLNPQLWNLVRIKYGPTTENKLLDCSQISIIDDTALVRCLTQRGSGSNLVFEATALNAKTAESFFEFSYPQVPVISSVTGCTADGSTTVDCPTTGNIPLTVNGDYFCDFSLANCSVYVQIGLEECTNPTYVSRFQFTCTLPEYSGIALPISILETVTNEGILQSVPVKYVSYSRAEITSVSGCQNSGSTTTQCSRTDSSSITIQGTNFGASDAIVLIGGYECENVAHDSSTPHQKLTCNAPPGGDLGQAVIILQSSGTLGAAFGQLSYAQCPAGTKGSADGSSLECIACDEGHFNPIEGATSCPACQPGTFSNETGLTACLSCSSGFASGSSATNCTECQAGTFSVSAASAYCSLCAVGRYNPSARQTTCLACSAGEFSDSPGATECSQCPAGTRSSISAAVTCETCVAGRFSGTSSSQTCTRCAAGKFASTSGQSACEECPAGKAQSAIGQTGCNPCDAGRFTASSMQTACSVCSAGTYSGVDSNGKTECFDCAAGEFNNLPSQASCKACDAGTFSSSRATACEPCSAGSYADLPGQSTCLNCSQSQGEFSSGSSNIICSECPAGKFAEQDAATICTDCDPGSYQPNPAQSSCLLCPQGRAVGTSGQVICDACIPGSVAPSDGTDSCTVCPAGTFQGGSSFDCQDCSPGFYSQFPGSEVCLPCPEGTFGESAGLSSCSPCIRGTITDATGLSTCSNCTSGKFAEEDGQNLCESCIAGTFSEAVSTSCTECTPGRAQITPVSSSCYDCTAGYFSTFSGTVNCLECAVGKYSNQSLATICTDCTAGKFQNNRARTTCKSCVVGEFSDSSGAQSCKICEAGKFSNATDSTFCYTCPAGSFSREGASTCELCSIGRFNLATGQPRCQGCAQGKFSNTVGALECTACAIGTSASSEGSSECTPCDEGSAAPFTGLSACLDCDVGNFANETASSDCMPCSEGSSQDEIGSASCEECEPGTFAEDPGLNVCDDCEPGKFSEVYGQSVCEECDAGSYQDNYGEQSCKDCELGKAVSKTGSRDCNFCARGTFSNDTGLAECHACDQGSFANDTGLEFCYLCGQGTFQEGTGQSRCKNCTRGTYQPDEGRASCIGCVAGKFSGVVGATVCENCTVGYANPTSGQEACKECLAGRYQPVEGQETCLLCDEGTHQNEVAQTACKNCTEGRFAGGRGFAVCLPCDSGTYTTLEGQSECQSCPLGEFQAALGKTTCENCTAGRYADQTGTKVCKLCEAGTAHNDTGLDKCPPCPGGQYQELQGQVDCKLCNAGTFSAPGQSDCTKCPSGQVSPSQGLGECVRCGIDSTNNENSTVCICKKGYYANTTIPEDSLDAGRVQCERCMEGALCDRAGITWDTLETRDGYWRANTNSTIFYKCLLLAHCTGGRQSNCGSHREGVLCAVCEDGYQVFGVDCRACTERSLSIFISTAMLLLIVSILCLMYYVLLKMDRQLLRKLKRKMEAREFDEFEDEYYLHADEVTQEATLEGAPPKPPNFVFKMKILLGFFQIAVGIAFAIEIPWPDSYKEFISLFNVANFDIIQWTRFGCVVEVDYYDKHLAVTVLPILAFVAILMLYLIPKYYNYRSASTRGNAEERRRLDLKFKRGMRKFWKMFLFTLFLIYPSVSSIVMRLYDCQKVEGTWYLSSDFTVQCDTDKWRERALINIVFVIIYPIGIPLFFFHLLFKNRNKLKTPEVMVALGFLYGAFELDAWWFELVDMSHKLFLTSVLTFFAQSQQLPAAMLALSAHLMLIHVLGPYSRKGDDRLHMLVQVELLLMVLAAWVYDQEEIIDSVIDRLLTAAFITMTMLVLLFFILQVYKIVLKFFRIKKTDETNVTGKIPTAAEMIRKRMTEGTQIVRNPAWLGLEEDPFAEESSGEGEQVEMDFDQGSKMMVPLSANEEKEEAQRGAIRRTFAPRAPVAKELQE